MATLNLKVDPRGVVQGSAVAEDALEDVTGAAVKTEDALDRMGKTGRRVGTELQGAATGARAVGRASAFGSNGLKGLAQQGSQVIDMGLATGQWGKAFFLQMSDMAMLLGGPLTIAIGSAIGVLGTLGLSFLNLDSSAKKASESLDTAANMLDEYIELTKAVSGVSAAFDSVTNSILTNSEAARDLLAIAKIDTFNSITQLNRDLASSVLDNSLLLGEIGDVGNLLGIETQLRGNITVWKENRAAAAEFRDQLEDLENAGSLDDMHAAAVRLRDAFKQNVNVQGEMTQEQLAFWKTLSQSIQQMELMGATIDLASDNTRTVVDAWNDATTAGQNALDVVRQLESPVVRAADAAAQFASNLFQAARARAQIIDTATRRGGGRGVVVPNASDITMMRIGGEFVPDRFPGSRRGRSGSDGANRAEREADQAIDAYERLRGSINPVVRELQEFERAQETVNKALATGRIDTEQAAEVMETVKQQYEAVRSGMDDFADAGGAVFDRLIEGSIDLKDALKQVVAEFIRARIQANILERSGGTTSSLGGFLLNGLFGGFFDNGGLLPFGQTGIVGENGPERITSTTRGTQVTSRAQTRREMQQTPMNLAVQVGVTVDDDLKLQAAVRRVGVQAAQTGRNAAVADVKSSLRNWNQQLDTDGALT